MKIKFEWETIDMENTRRAKVFGGWIINTLLVSDWSVSETTLFIPDPEHEWEID